MLTIGSGMFHPIHEKNVLTKYNICDSYHSKPSAKNPFSLKTVSLNDAIEPVAAKVDKINHTFVNMELFAQSFLTDLKSSYKAIYP